MAGPTSVLIAEASTEQLTGELAKLVRKGLPATEATAGDLLPNLRSVVARAIHPANSFSHLDALNELLPRLIDQLTDEAYREAVRILFGLAPGTRKTGLMSRRRQAAAHLGYNADHFRLEIEPEMLAAVAEVVHRDLLRYQSRIKRASESLEPTGDTPRLTEADLSHEEELISRIWQHVYGLRAEVIAHARLAEHEGYEAQAEDHRQAALREEAALHELLVEYTETYGTRLIRHGDAEFATEALERLAAWQA